MAKTLREIESEHAEIVAKSPLVQSAKHGWHPSLGDLEKLIACITEERLLEQQRCLEDVVAAWPLEALRDLREGFLRQALTMEDLQVQTVAAVKRHIVDSIAARAAKSPENLVKGGEI